jgi:hypothetical protein
MIRGLMSLASARLPYAKYQLVKDQENCKADTKAISRMPVVETWVLWEP